MCGLHDPDMMDLSSTPLGRLRSIRSTISGEGSVPVQRSGPAMLSRTKSGSVVNSSALRAGEIVRISLTLRRIPSSWIGRTSRSRCTTKSIEEANTRLTIDSVTFSPAMTAALTSADSASRAELA